MMRCGRLVAGVIALLAMCLGAGMPRGTGVPAATAAAGWVLPAGPITIGEWDGGDGTKSHLLMDLIAQYEKMHPNIKIQFETDVKSLTVAAAVAAGTAPVIFEAPDSVLPKYISAGALEPLPPAAWGKATVDGVLTLYLPHVLDGFMAGHTLYAVPDQMNAHSLWINNRLFREAGLDPMKDAPKTWADVARLNAKLTKKQGDRITQKGFEFRYICDDGHWEAQLFQALVYQAGGQVLQDGRPAFNGPAGVEALNTWKSLVTAPQVTQNTCSSPYQDFAVEQDAMTFAGPNGGPVFEQVNPKMKGNMTVVPLPQIRPDHPVTLIYSFNWTVNARASAAQKRVAWDLIHFFSTQPTLWWTRIGFLQGAEGWYKTPEAQRTPFLNVFNHDLSVGRPVPRTTHYPELQAALKRMMDRVILNNADPKQALDQAAEEYTRAAR